MIVLEQDGERKRGLMGLSVGLPVFRSLFGLLKVESNPPVLATKSSLGFET